jgi:aminopeptidase N
MPMKNPRFAVFLFTLLTVASFAQPETDTYLHDPSWQARDKPIDILHLEAHILVNPYDTTVDGTVVFTFHPMRHRVDSVNFHASEFIFQSITIDGIELRYVKRGDQLTVFPVGLEKGKEYRLALTYRAMPRHEFYLVGWREPALRDNKQVWAHRPHHWMPYYEDRLTVDMYITFDGAYEVFSNGSRESVVSHEDGTRTWHYRMEKDHPFFSTALVIGKYKYKESVTSSGIPLEFWYYPWQEDHLEPTYRYTEKMFDFLEKELGYPYPYPLYREAPVEDYLYGAMETTTSTIFGDYLHIDERAWSGRNYVNVNIHELTHQWFGNCVAHLRNRDVWLTESFATYYAKMFEKAVFGDDYYQWVKLQEWNETMEAAAKDDIPVGHSQGGRARWYPKGSLVLDMLHDVMGEEDFKASIKYYLESHAFNTAETNDFLAAIYKATGRPMEWFFDQWICHAGEPEYQVSYISRLAMNQGSETVVRISQVQEVTELLPLFRMPVNLEVYYDNGNKDRITRWISGENEEVIIPNPLSWKVDFIVFDPGNRILKKLQFGRSAAELMAQAERAQEMIDRYDALVLLSDHPMELKKELLIRAYEEETFHLVRGEALRQLSREYTPDLKNLFIHAINDPDPLVRRAVLESLKKVPLTLKPEYEKLLLDESYINVELALDNLCASFPENAKDYLELTGGENGWRGRNIRMKWLEIAISRGDKTYLEELVDYSSPRYEFETRMNAFIALKRLNYLNTDAAMNLFWGYLYWNYKVSGEAAKVLKYFSQQLNHRALLYKTLEQSRLNNADKERIRALIG